MSSENYDPDDIFYGEQIKTQLKAAETPSENLLSLPDGIKNLPYYQGFLPRRDAEDMVLEKGDFLLRRSRIPISLEDRKRENTVEELVNISGVKPSDDIDEPNIPGDNRTLLADEWAISLTIRISESEVKHIGFPRKKDGPWIIDNKRETDDLGEYLEECRRSGVPLFTDDERYTLKHPIPTTRWQYKHDQIMRPPRPAASGACGKIYRGYLVLNDKRLLLSAIKCLPDDVEPTSAQINDFVREANVMRLLQHPNIVKFRGIAAFQIPVMMVLEWCPNGDLLDHMTNDGESCNMRERARHALDVANGLAYLASQNIIHRDIAARNCLFDKYWRLKITDFGLAQTAKMFTAEENYLHPTWQAPESVAHGIFTPKTDVWSYGVLLYEIYSDGDVPYEYDDPFYVRREILKGERPQPPEEMPAEVRNVMRMCHREEPDQRPEFSEIKELMKEIYRNT